jgi:hypothetical protein
VGDTGATLYLPKRNKVETPLSGRAQHKMKQKRYCFITLFYLVSPLFRPVISGGGVVFRPCFALGLWVCRPFAQTFVLLAIFQLYTARGRPLGRRPTGHLVREPTPSGHPTGGCAMLMAQ